MTYTCDVCKSERVAGKFCQCDFDKIKAERDAVLLQIDELKKQAEVDRRIINGLYQKTDATDRLISEIVDAWKEQKAVEAANVPSGEFKEDDLRGGRVSAAKKRLALALDAVLTPEIKRCEHCGVDLPANESHGRF